jgi:undecaprenyl phosphate N,N'-diacetylbacillosamine 1-phosphate transferase
MIDARRVKRLFDFVSALAGLIVISPLFALLAALIKLDSRGPVFFMQERIGQDGRPFQIYKFRTMVVGAEKMGAGYLVDGQDDPRITRLGRFLRLAALDELPQLINILRGEMSIVGPRPTLRYQVEQYDDYQRRRLLAPPGVTGWAQIHGRNEISWPERICYDVWYVDNWSLWLDLRILLRTPALVLSRRGLYGDESKFIIHPSARE